MQPDYIIIKEYIQRTQIDPDFIVLLEENGLIEVYVQEGEKYLPSNQLTDVEKFARMYYDLSINIEGIDAINNLLQRMQELQDELDYLRSKLRIYE